MTRTLAILAIFCLGMTFPAQVAFPDDPCQFGYYLWLDITRNIQFTWGYGGQFAFIVPDQIQADEALPVVDQIIEACN